MLASSRGRVDLVENAERTRFVLEDRHQQPDRRQRFLAAGEQRDILEPLPGGRCHDFDARLTRVLGLDEPHFADSAAEQRGEHSPEVDVDLFERLVELFPRDRVDFVDRFLGVADRVQQVLPLGVEKLVALLRLFVLLQGKHVHRAEGSDLRFQVLVEVFGFGQLLRSALPEVRRELGERTLQLAPAGFVLVLDVGVQLDEPQLGGGAAFANRLELFSVLLQLVFHGSFFVAARLDVVGALGRLAFQFALAGGVPPDACLEFLVLREQAFSLRGPVGYLPGHALPPFAFFPRLFPGPVQRDERRFPALLQRGQLGPQHGLLLGEPGAGLPGFFHLSGKLADGRLGRDALLFAFLAGPHLFDTAGLCLVVLLAQSLRIGLGDRHRPFGPIDLTAQLPHFLFDGEDFSLGALQSGLDRFQLRALRGKLALLSFQGGRGRLELLLPLGEARVPSRAARASGPVAPRSTSCRR